MGLEIKVCGKDTGTNQLFLQDIHEIEQILWLATTDVIYRIGRDGQAIFTLLALWGSLHHAIHALYDVINIGEVTTTVAIVKYLDGLALQQLIGEAKVCHIWTSSRTIHRKETQARCWDVVQF